MSKLRSATVCFSVGVYQILNEISVHETLEMSLVAEAIRRSTRKLNDDASIEEIRDYLSGYEEKALNGVLANVKGIYHEMLFVDDYNASHTDTYAAMHESTTHPGSDVIIFSSDDNEQLAEYQFKSTNSEQLINAHFEKYPDIEVKATEEVSSKNIDNVESSGYTNEEITDDVQESIGKLMDKSFEDQVLSSACFTTDGFLLSAGRSRSVPSSPSL